ncbi:MAG: 50S ribosomal protein L32e [Methanobacteriota archaeon]
MADDERKEAKPVKRAKKALEAPPEAPKEAPATPTPAEVRAARKAQLVAWCTAFGLDPDGKVDELRERLLEHIEEAEKKAKPPPAPEEAKEAEAKAAKKAPERKAEEAAEEEEPHVARQKPKLDDRMRALLRMRRETAARRPAFRRQEWFRYRKFGDEWRKPQGGQSKLRRHFGYRWNVPSIGYRGPRGVRGLHPSGFEEVLVHNLRELEGVDPARQAVRIAHAVGTRKRDLIEKACDEREIRVLNRMVTR